MPSGPRRSVAAALALIAVLGACTSGSPPAPPSATDGGPTASSPPPTPTAELASGEPLPDGCDEGRPRTAQTITFVAEGRAWALDPRATTLTCLFYIDEAQPFAWGPRADRVLLGGLEVRGVTASAPDLPQLGVRPAVLDWGHPLGLAVVFARERRRIPEKRFVDDGHIESLLSMPRGRYLDIAYHPSGLALGFSIEQHREESIWISRNDGTQPERLVFSEGGTRFPSVAFSSDGQRLVWIARHLNTYQVHWMDLADRTGFEDGWKGDVGEDATNLHLAPRGDLMALDEGTSCSDRTALAILSPTVARPLLPDESRPTTVVGWLDRTTVLVAAGGCDQQLNLVAVDVIDQTAADLVHGVDIAAARARAPIGPDSVPAPGAGEPPPPPEGVG